LDRRGCDWQRACALGFILILGSARFISAQAAGNPAGGAARALAAAQDTFSRGDAQQALEKLRKLRSDFPDSPAVIDSYGLSVSWSLKSGDEYRARFYCQKLIDLAPSSSVTFTAGTVLAQHYYDGRVWSAALEYYDKAIAGFRVGVTGEKSDLDLALLRAAELALYHAGDPDGARAYFQRIDPSSFAVNANSLYRAMSIRLLWSVLSADFLGIHDSNISCLRIDGDDLWVGTWNGGVARYSVSSGGRDAYVGPSFSRSIEIADRRVWIGTAEGLAWYGKGTARWGSESEFGAPTPSKVQVVRATSSGLFAGTLGDGLFRHGDAGWDPVSDGSLPGKFITSLAEDAAHGRLLIGTMNFGLIIMNMKTGAMNALSESSPAFTAENVTTILPARDGMIWIGTYGDGLYAWRGDSGDLRHYTKADSRLADDWILASAETDRALYFGSFGGGVSVLSKKQGTWRNVGISDGLTALDIPAIAWRAPYVFFGTLGGGVYVYDEAADVSHP
jgi:tetratricopeptide (TPR) repeat protein